MTRDEFEQKIIYQLEHRGTADIAASPKVLNLNAVATAAI